MTRYFLWFTAKQKLGALPRHQRNRGQRRRGWSSCLFWSCLRGITPSSARRSARTECIFDGSMRFYSSRCDRHNTRTLNHRCAIISPSIHPRKIACFLVETSQQRRDSYRLETCWVKKQNSKNSEPSCKVFLTESHGNFIQFRKLLKVLRILLGFESEFLGKTEDSRRKLNTFKPIILDSIETIATS